MEKHTESRWFDVALLLWRCGTSGYDENERSFLGYGGGQLKASDCQRKDVLHVIVKHASYL